MEHKLGLFENAIDSLNEALRQYSQGNIDRPQTYKFAILLFAQSIELLFKYQVSKHHPLFVYKNPFSKKLLSGEENTINLWDAIQFLKNTGQQIDSNIIRDIKWIKKLRNDIEHYQFSMNVHEVRLTISRLLSAFDKLNSKLLDVEIEQIIKPSLRKEYIDLISEHNTKLLQSQKLAYDNASKNELCNCFFCNSEKAAYLRNNIMTCFFCGTREKFYTCEACGLYYPERQIAYIGEVRSCNGNLVAVVCHSCEYYLE